MELFKGCFKDALKHDSSMTTPFVAYCFGLNLNGFFKVFILEKEILLLFSREVLEKMIFLFHPTPLWCTAVILKHSHTS